MIKSEKILDATQNVRVFTLHDSKLIYIRYLDRNTSLTTKEAENLAKWLLDQKTEIESR
jgi:hypothetical protein